MVFPQGSFPFPVLFIADRHCKTCGREKGSTVTEALGHLIQFFASLLRIALEGVEVTEFQLGIFSHGTFWVISDYFVVQAYCISGLAEVIAIDAGYHINGSRCIVAVRV